MGKGLKLIS